ncbi:MAG: hypothetical protein EPN47_02105 [Acidobacteria bacterium]|nr:MAG: hypothetical protein EPN47_02105 [Acidobacteriota bacterium]
MGQKKSFFEKRTGEVVENKGSASKNEPERTGKRSGEVVENTRALKKRTGTNLETKRAMILKIIAHRESDVAVADSGLALISFFPFRWLPSGLTSRPLALENFATSLLPRRR